jgi:hypothetical protein
MSTVTLKLRRRDLAWAAALVLLLSTTWVARSDIADAGSEPPGEGIAVVYIAVGTGFADALGVGPGAGLNGAPIILVPTNPPLDTDTSAELIRLDPRAVIIVGGTGVVSTTMEDTLEALLPNAAVSRIAGTNRYKTNAAFSAATFPIEGWVSVNSVGFGGGIPATQDVNATETVAYNATNGFVSAPIQLPDGATILELKASVNDASGTDFIRVILVRQEDGATNVEVASAATTGIFAGGAFTLSSTAIAAGTEIVDNGTYTYFVRATGADGVDGVYLRNIRVRYQLGASG